MATGTQQRKLKELYDRSMAAGGLRAFARNWEQSIGIHRDPDTHIARFEQGNRELDHRDWAIGEVFDAICGPRWRKTLDQFWDDERRKRFEGVGATIMPGELNYVSGGIDAVAGLLNARALAIPAGPEWIWDRMCTVQEAQGEGGFHIGARALKQQPFTDLSDGQTLPEAAITSTRIHRNRTLNQGLRVKVNYWTLRDDLTSQVTEAVDQTAWQVLAERERKVADACMGVSTGTTLGTGTSIGKPGLAMPMVQDALTWFPWQKGIYGTNANATTPAPENGLAIANYANANETDGKGLTDYTAIVRAMQTLLANRDPFTGLPTQVSFQGMQFLCAPAARVQVEFLLQAEALWQIANSGFTTTGGTATVSGYNLMEKFRLEIIDSQFWFNRLVDAGAYKISSAGSVTHQVLTNAVGDTFSTAGSIMSAFFMGHFQDALIYWQRMPYQAVQVPLSSIEFAEQTVMVQDHRERGQVFWVHPREVWRAWA